MEKAAEQGSAIAAAVEGVERQFGSNSSGTMLLASVYLLLPSVREHIVTVL